MFVVDAWANEPHFVAHLAPIWELLPDGLRGRFFASRQVVPFARSLGLDVTPVSGWRPPIQRFRDPRFGPVLVASISTANTWARSGRPIVLLNHGAGQTYNVDHPSYSGGRHRTHIAMFLEPGPHAAEATRKMARGRPVVEVGSPKLDRYHRDGWDRPHNPQPVVAISTHWDCRVVPETRSALGEFEHQLDELVAANVDVVGHSHPRCANDVNRMFAKHGIPFVRNFDRILETADVYVCDNSSTLYEFASTGRPVVCLNGAGYRKDVDHGLRFWDAVPGVQCDPDQSLLTAIGWALDDPPTIRARRERAVGRAYMACDGEAAARAAEAIIKFAAGMDGHDAGRNFDVAGVRDGARSCDLPGS